MKLLSITLCRFGSFRNEVTFDFPEGPGLFFLRGENEQEPALEANGAGKSTIWNAICWASFDRTVKGLRAGDVANWEESKAARVTLTYQSDDGSTFALTRQHAPNKWFLQCLEPAGVMDTEEWDLAKDDTNLYLQELQLDLEPFLNCVLMGQGRPMFIDLPATKKAELFSDVLGLDVWLERSRKAATKATEQDIVTRDIERKLADVEGQLRGIDHQALDGSASEWKTEHDKRLQVIEDRYADAMADRKAKRGLLASRQAAVDKHREQLKKDVADEVLTIQRWQQATETAREATRDAADGERYCNKESKAIQDFRHLADCPTCKQKVPHDHRKSIADAMQAKLTKEAERQIERWSTEKYAKDDVEICKAETERWASFVEQCRTKLEVAAKDLRQVENDIAFIDKDLDRLEDEAERVNAERNPFASMRQEALNREEVLQARRANLQRLLGASEERQYLLASWAKWFKEMRLQLINSSLQQLEIEVNSNVAELGLQGWELRFEVDKENKSGGVTKGFNVRVVSPHNERSVPWESWSGGEGQRLRIATQEGLADLIRVRTGCTLDLEAWDEPTEHLSGQGVTDLLDSLAARAQREQRQIWVVDHRALGFGNFTDVYTVIKDNNGSRIERK